MSDFGSDEFCFSRDASPMDQKDLKRDKKALEYLIKMQPMSDRSFKGGFVFEPDDSGKIRL
jgi:hypothetical protein